MRPKQVTSNVNVFFFGRISLEVTFNRCKMPGLETYFFSNSQTFASGLNLNSQIAVHCIQLAISFAIISKSDSLNHVFLLI